MAKSSFFSGSGTDTEQYGTLVYSKQQLEDALTTVETNTQESEDNAASAASSASDAAQSATNAANSASSASGEAQASTDAKLASEAARDQAQTYANDASTSATNAASSASAASTSETNAASSAASADAHRVDAQTARDAAQASEAAASTSETNAASSASAASSSASSADTSASAASTSETNAASSASAAASSASAADTSAQAASTSESNAVSSASAASTSETNSAASASAASTSESNAAVSENNALTYRNEAESFANSMGKFEVKSVSTDYTVPLSENGFLFVVDTSAAAVTLTLPLIADAGEPYNIRVKKVDNSSNSLSVAPSGTDTINGVTQSVNYTVEGSGARFASDLDDSPDNWATTSFGSSTKIAKRDYLFTLADGQASISGTDDDGQTFAYTVGAVDVVLNGISLTPGADYTASDGQTLTLTEAAAEGDELFVRAWAAFDVSDTYTKAEVDQKDDAKLDKTGGDVTGDLTVQGTLAQPNCPAFMTTFSYTQAGASGSTLVYDSIQAGQNVGGCYDTSTGMFTAPVDGKYCLIVSSIGNSQDGIYRYYFMLNGASTGIHLRLANRWGTGTDYVYGEKTVVLSLQAGDQVNIQFISEDGATSTTYGTGYDTFSGYFIG